MQIRKPLAFLRMSDRIELELQVQQQPLLILAHLAQIRSHRIDPLADLRKAQQPGRQHSHIAADIVFKDGKKHIFFILEVVIKRPTRLTRLQRDIFDPRVLKPIPCEDRSC